MTPRIVIIAHGHVWETQSDNGGDSPPSWHPHTASKAQAERGNRALVMEPQAAAG
jgi:hypothetical protein